MLGSLDRFLIGTESFSATLQRFYKQYPNESLIGIYEIMLPIFVICDPELIKHITIQDFDCFMNRQTNFDADANGLLHRTLFFMKDERWKNMRITLSPAFTGTKMRMMFGLIQDSTHQFIDYLKTAKFNDDIVELKDLYTRIGNDIIATCAFGLKVNSLIDKNNEFHRKGKEITNFNGIQSVKFLLFDTIPEIMKLLKVKFFIIHFPYYTYRQTCNEAMCFGKW